MPSIAFVAAISSKGNGKGKIEIEYVFQSLDKYTEGYTVAADRVKPWGTAHALLCCKEVVKEAFAVINADDYYGKEAFEQSYTFLTKECNEKTNCILGYELSNTLSENGTVSRGVCSIDTEGYLKQINERTTIYRRADGQIVFEENGVETSLQEDTRVSMNFMCFGPGFIDLCEKEFDLFLKAKGQELKSEFYIPYVAGRFHELGLGKVKVIPTNAKWFGVTYPEDRQSVVDKIQALVDAGEYPAKLF